MWIKDLIFWIIIIVCVIKNKDNLNKPMILLLNYAINK